MMQAIPSGFNAGRGVGWLSFTRATSTSSIHLGRHSFSFNAPLSHLVSRRLIAKPEFWLGTSSFSSRDDCPDSHSQVSFTKNSGNTEEVEAHGQALHTFGSSSKLEQAAGRFDIQQHEGNTSPAKRSDYQVDIASEHHADVYNHTPSVNLSACMQSQVPEPYGKTPSHMNMPGGVARREVS